MSSRNPHSTCEIVPASSHALTVRSAALVARGLRDLARESNWFIKKAFSGPTSHLAISPTGQLCAMSPLVGAETECVALYDIERGTPNIALSVPGEPSSSAMGLPAAFAWSSTGRHLVAAWHGWGNRLHAFDLGGQNSVGAFGGFSQLPRCLAWSDSGHYFASARGGGADGARVRLWQVTTRSGSSSRGSSATEGPLEFEPLTEVGGVRSFEEWIGQQPLDTESADEGAFAGFGRIAFTPDESALACVVEMEGEWADDSIVVLDVPTLRRLRVFPAQGRLTGLAWAFDSRNLIYCSAGQAYRISSNSLVSESLPFGAEFVACHPHLPLCLCFSSWLKNSAKGRLFVADLNTLSTQDECAAEGVVDLRWSLDGSKAYAVTPDGLAYIYEPPLI
jgi:WD40 repeat protein